MRNELHTSERYQIFRGKKRFSEQEIMNLQDLFLTNGFHDIVVSSVEEGRLLIQTFFNALNYYKHVACLSMSSKKLPDQVSDIYQTLSESGEINQKTIFEFLMNHFYADLLVVEMSKKLMSEKWLTEFQQQLIDFKIDAAMPIISISYSQLG